MEGPAMASRENNAAIIPPILNGIANSAKDDNDAKSASLNHSSGSVSSNGNTSNSSRTHQPQSKLNNSNGDSGSVGGGEIQDKWRTSTSTDPGNDITRHKKAAAGVELKSKIIEFMRDKPYLWNRWHPGYNDNKRRENEFSLFSHEIDCPVPEIKRVWHVLRTNFFRAHKYQSERGPNGVPDKGDRCWKYYQSMKFILESTHNNSNFSKINNSITDEASNSNNVSVNDDSSSSVKDIRQTRSSKVQKDARGNRRTVQKTTQMQPINNINDSSSSNSSNAPHPLVIATAVAPTPTTAIISTSTPTTSASDNITFSSGTRSNRKRSLRAHRDDNHDTSIITNISSDQFGLARGRASTLSAFSDLSRISFDADDDHLYSRSLTATLKKFDPTTKEVIKLKFQEIIVEHMQKQQQQLQLFQQLQPPAQQQLALLAATKTTTQPKQT